MEKEGEGEGAICLSIWLLELISQSCLHQVKEVALLLNINSMEWIL